MTLWMVMLGVQALPYAATLITAIVSAISNRVAAALPAPEAVPVATEAA